MGDIILRDFDGNTLSSFWRYGFVTWELFYDCIRTIIFTSDDWAIFEYDENAPGKHGTFCSPSDDLPKPRLYILLRPDGTPIRVGLTALSARHRHPTVFNTPARTDHYRRRVFVRDPCCLISGQRVVGGDYSRFKAAHIFPHAQVKIWTSKGFPSRITDPAPLGQQGGRTKIDSIQNVLLLRSDLHDAWDNYKIAVNPDKGYTVIAFVPGYEDIVGRTLMLNHIADLNLRPLDDLFRDHFTQGVLRNMKGAAEPTWDYGYVFGGMDLSRQDLGEFEVACRLHSLRPGPLDDIFRDHFTQVSPRQTGLEIRKTVVRIRVWTLRS
ncbi:hypothetical protein PAXINDRAFT_18119 [Paxillus involutus ATCC 200175]|uniref:HNH nuclease domain-containing protein n=1 Tax=Paxillus involutus ATCC 200175 TaxID=664439 RepID=A0A0C9SZM5_PAXIN|nr:hypothetical protein PAXINDRAFT_18119 [Paxillus involutus ATCC 200175]